MKRTSRGFRIYTTLVDTYGNTVRIQESSAAFKRRCWIFTSGEPSRDKGNPPAPHLSPAQARRIAAALLRFADGGPR